MVTSKLRARGVHGSALGCDHFGNASADTGVLRTGINSKRNW